MKFTHSKRKAVAPVLATLLMIAVAVAMSVIIFMWSQGFLSQTSGSTGSQQGAQNQAAQSSVAIELANFVACPSTGCVASTSPKITMVVRNVGAVAVTLGSLTITGSSSNSGFTGSYQIGTIVYASTALTSTDAACTSTNAPTEAVTSSSGTTTISKGTSATITITPSATPCTTSGRMFSGDVANIKVTTSVGTFASAQFTVP